MDRSELVRKFEIIDKLMERVKGWLSELKLELNDDGYYSVEKINNEAVKKYASLYNKMADIKKKGIANLTEEDKIFLRDSEGLKNLANSTGITDFDTKTKSYSFEELMEEIIKLNPEVQLAYDKEGVANRAIYCSVAGDKLNLPKGYYYNAKNGITNKHTTSTGAYTSNSVFDISKAPSDAIKVNVEDKEDKKEEITEEKKETPKESTEGKKEVKRGSFGEVVSCLVGQVDKRVNNWWYGDEKKGKKRYEHTTKKRQERYDNLGSYAIRRGFIAVVIGSIGIVALPLGGVMPLAVAIGAGVYGISAINKVISDLRRKGPKPVIPNKKIAKGSYLENIKNAWTKFRKPKQKTNEVKKTKVAVNPTKTEVKEDDASKKKQEMINKVREILVSMNYDSFRENISNLKFVRNCYSKVENELDKECKDKYAFWNGILEYVEGLSKAVSDKDKAKANFYYKRLLNVCGESDNLKKIITVEVLNAYNELSKEVKTETVEKTEEKVEKTVDTLKLTKLSNYIIGFELKPTMESIKECEKLIQQIFSLNDEERKVIRANSEVWNKVKFLMKKSKEYCEEFKHLKNNDIVSVFIKLVETFDFKGEEVKYDRNQLMVCMNIYSRLSDAEKALIPENIMVVYNDALRFDSVFTLKAKLSMLDIEKSIKENNYSEIFECCGIYDKYVYRKNDNNDVSHKRKLGRTEIENFPQNLKDKLDRILEIREKYKKQENSIYGNAHFSVSYDETEFNGKRLNVALVDVELNGDLLEQFAIPLKNNLPCVDEIIAGIIQKHPFVKREQIEIEELVAKKGNSR